jgi:hypothetical protein
MQSSLRWLPAVTYRLAVQAVTAPAVTLSHRNWRLRAADLRKRMAWWGAGS